MRKTIVQLYTKEELGRRKKTKWQRIQASPKYLERLNNKLLRGFKTMAISTVSNV